MRPLSIREAPRPGGTGALPPALGIATLKRFVSDYVAVRPHHRSSVASDCLPYIGDRAFPVAAARVWISLQSGLVAVTSTPFVQLSFGPGSKVTF